MKETFYDDLNKPPVSKKTRVTREIEGLALRVMNQLYAQHTGS